jgi:hypothetical protein
MSGILQRLCRRIIAVAIKDIKNGNLHAMEQYIGSDTFTIHRKLAGYPEELDDTLADAMLCSETQRRRICEEVIWLLDQLEEKKETPTEAGVLRRSIT